LSGIGLELEGVSRIDFQPSGFRYGLCVPMDRAARDAALAQANG
jgi:hypothetical protein